MSSAENELTDGTENEPNYSVKAPAKDRFTVVEQVYHRPMDSDPELFRHGYSRELQTTEQVYRRQIKVGEDWTPLDTGWLEDKVGMICLSNEEGKRLQVYPTEEEQAEIDEKIIQVSYDQDPDRAWIIPPGETFRSSPSSQHKLFIRCLSGVARCDLFIVPK